MYSKKLKFASPPPNERKKPISKDKHSSKEDFGGHQRALNFFSEAPPEIYNTVKASKSKEVQLSISGEAEAMSGKSAEDQKIGTMVLGLAYEGNWKANSKTAGNGEHKTCKVSRKYMNFLLIVLESLQKQMDKDLYAIAHDCLRMNIIFGANTLGHTDAYKGNTPNYLYIAQDRPDQECGCLVYDNFPKFKSSVVMIDNRYYIPHSWSQAADRCICYTEDPQKPGCPKFIMFKSNIIDAMQPVYDLPYGIIGKDKDKLQALPFAEPHRIICKPINKKFTYLTWDEIISEARAAAEKATAEGKPPKKPRNRIRSLDKVNEWQAFSAWQYRHWWVGEPKTLRYHVFFRTVRENPNGTNVQTTGKRINYIDATSDQWKYHSNKDGWQQLDLEK